MQNPAITVIVPFYKVQKYFAKCLDSIVNQSFKDLEIILIDDCGNDNSIKIAQSFADKDSRIRIIRNKKNKGQGYSRNLGIEQAKGEYIAFVDADDWLEPDMYEKLYTKAIETDSDIVKCNFRYIYKDHSEPYPLNTICSDYSKLYKVHDDPEHILGMLITAVWNGLYKKKFLIKHNIRFIESKFEDMIFCWKAKISAVSISFVSDILYNYLKINPNSDTNTTKYYHYFLDNCYKLKQLVRDTPKLYNALFIYSTPFFENVYKKAKYKDKKRYFFMYHDFLSSFKQDSFDFSSVPYLNHKRIKNVINGNYIAYRYSWISNIKKVVKYAIY